MNLVIKPSMLMEKKSLLPLDELLLFCVAKKMCLHIELIGYEVHISADEIFPNTNKVIEVFGDWRSPYIDGRSKYIGAMLLSPFLFKFKKISIPHKKLMTLGRSTRSIADFVVRNLFYSISRGERVYFTRFEGVSNAVSVDDFSDRLRKAYLWMIKSFIKEDFFSNKNFDSLMLSATHLNLNVFKTSLLMQGVNEFYDVVQEKSGDVSQKEYMDFNQVRMEILNLIG